MSQAKQELTRADVSKIQLNGKPYPSIEPYNFPI